MSFSHTERASRQHNAIHYRQTDRQTDCQTELCATQQTRMRALRTSRYAAYFINNCCAWPRPRPRRSRMAFGDQHDCGQTCVSPQSHAWLARWRGWGVSAFNGEEGAAWVECAVLVTSSTRRRSIRVGLHVSERVHCARLPEMEGGTSVHKAIAWTPLSSGVASAGIRLCAAVAESTVGLEAAADHDLNHVNRSCMRSRYRTCMIRSRWGVGGMPCLVLEGCALGGAT